MQLEVVAAGQLPRQQSLLDVPRHGQILLDTFLFPCQPKEAGVLNDGGALHGERLQHLPIESCQGRGAHPAFQIEDPQEFGSRLPDSLAAPPFHHRELL